MVGSSVDYYGTAGQIVKDLKIKTAVNIILGYSGALKKVQRQEDSTRLSLSQQDPFEPNHKIGHHHVNDITNTYQPKTT